MISPVNWKPTVNKRREVIEDTCHLVHSSQQMERRTLNVVCNDGHIACVALEVQQSVIKAIKSALLIFSFTLSYMEANTFVVRCDLLGIL